MVGFLGLKGSLELLLRFGTQAIAGRLLEVTELVCERLRRIGAVIHSDRRPAHASGIVSVELPGRDPTAMRKHCLAQGVVLNCRAGRLRISPHAYTSLEDVERLVEAFR